MKAIPVVTGRPTNRKAAKKMEARLSAAIRKSTLIYKNAPAATNEPTGMIVLYRPDGPISNFPHVFDVEPWEAKWIKG